MLSKAVLVLSTFLLAVSPTILAAAPPVPKVEVAFSPDAGAEDLVIKVIASSRLKLRMAAYSFTSPRVVEALLAAKRRGVDVRVVVDHKNNIDEDRSKKAHAALNLLVNAQIPTRTIKRYSIHHDKYIIVDDTTVETGSFNYSKAAAERNSENVVVLWGDSANAGKFEKHWLSRFADGVDYHSTY